MKSLSVLALMLAATVAKAEVYTCNFTEPFFGITIDSTTGTVIKDEPNWMAPDGGTVETVLATDASVIQTVMDGVETIYVVPKDQPALMKLSLTWQGSDGMSDTIYPYDGEILIEKDSNLFGGCRSTTKEPRMPEGLEE